MNPPSTALSRRWLLAAMAAVVLAIALTRGLSLSYNMDIHPDENKFYDASTSLLESWLYGTEYVEEKPYPEGAYLFHLPFQAIRMAVTAVTGQEQSLRLWGRIASVFYFTLATVLGMDLVARFLGKSKLAVVLYGTSMCFSLFFLEQSRYGVGDMISLFLLMLILQLLAKWCSRQKGSTLLWTCFWCGVLGAVKYPQLYFLVLPVFTWYFTTAGGWKEKGKRLLVMLLVCFAGFLLFSPKAIFDWAYFYRVIRREMGAYVTGSVGGGAHNTLTMLLSYHLLYAGFPLAPVFLAAGMAGFLKDKPLARVRQCLDQGSREAFLFRFVLPLTIFGFFAYNLFVTVLAMRTLTPYFGLCALYVPGLAASFAGKSRFRRLCCGLLTVVLIGRGICMTALLSRDVYHTEFAAAAQQVLAQQDGRGRVITFRYSYIPHKEFLQDREVIKLDIKDFQESNGGSYALQPGDVVIVGSLEYSSALPYPLPTADARSNANYDAWKAFQAENEEYLVAVATPAWPYYLLGAWVKGGSFANFTYPCSYLYYVP